MDEAVLLRILPVMINNYLDLVDHEWTEEQKNELSKEIAQVAWNGLIALLRQGLAGSDEITLAEFGTFSKSTSGGWTFVPAASLEETSALRLPFKEGVERISDRLLFHLDAAIDLIKTLAFDVTQPPPVVVTKGIPMGYG